MSTEPVPPERSNPVIWTTALVLFVAVVAWWFATMMSSGRHYALQHPVSITAGPTGDPEPDHAAFIERIQGGDQDLLKLGKQVWQNGGCTTCHGPQGGEPKTAGARNFHTEALKNGADPYGMYQTIAEGALQAMPIQAQLEPEEVYAVIHYIREAFIEPDNPNYDEDALAVTDAYLAESPWPPPGGVGGEGPPTGDDFVLEAPVAATMHERTQALADEERARQIMLAAAARSQGRVRAVLTRIGDDLRTGALALAVTRAAESGDAERIVAIAGDPGREATLGALALMTDKELESLVDSIRSVSGAAGAEGGER